MRCVIICISVSQMNTQKVVEAMTDVLNSDVKKLSQIEREIIPDYDLVGFVSGIFYGKHHSSLLEVVETLPLNNKNVFIGSTSGRGIGKKDHRALRKKLLIKGAHVLDEFACKGFDTYGPFKLIGGINKGRPNEADLHQAEIFVRSLVMNP